MYKGIPQRGNIRKPSDFGVGTAARATTRWQDNNISRRLILKYIQKFSMDFQDTLRIPSWLKTIPLDHPRHGFWPHLLQPMEISP
jgi:hypothetical protein